MDTEGGCSCTGFVSKWFPGRQVFLLFFNLKNIFTASVSYRGCLDVRFGFP